MVVCVTGLYKRKREVTCEQAGKALSHKVPLDCTVHIQTRPDCTVGKDLNFYKHIIHTGFNF